MTWISSIIGYPLGWVMWALYQLFSNYGVALLVFTLIARALMIPTALKTQKNSVKMAMIRPQLEELQKKYGNNRNKLNEETMKLYEKEGYSLSSGCLPMLIQFPILFGLIDVIYKPLTHILRMSSEAIEIGQRIATNMGLIQSNAANSTVQMAIIRGVSTDPGAFSAMNTLDPGAIASIESLIPKLNFLGIDLIGTPSLSMFREIFTSFNPLLLIPILSGGSALVMSLVSLQTTKHTTQNQAGAGSMKGMMLMMPIFSLWITFSVPAGVGLYWTFSNLAGIAQTLIMHKIYNPKEMAEKAQQAMEERKERERLERIEAKKKVKEGKLEEKQKAMSQKELNRLKLAEARKRDAEKYGEVYDDAAEDA